VYQNEVNMIERTRIYEYEPRSLALALKRARVARIQVAAIRIVAIALIALAVFVAIVSLTHAQAPVIGDPSHEIADPPALLVARVFLPVVER
jgi:hypothetical protein